MSEKAEKDEIESLELKLQNLLDVNDRLLKEKRTLTNTHEFLNVKIYVIV